jgi:curli production assembly/transport component CsgG
MIKTLVSLAVITMLTGCATSSAIREKLTGNQFDEPKVEQNVYLKKQSETIKPPAGGPITVAVYGFKDLTGQRKSVPLIASLSSAVTQGADAYLIKALQDVGEARWFTVVERVGLENLIKERQMIRQMRELYQGRDAKPLPPMLFAGMILEGGIVGYDSNTLTGGSGMRIFGIGAQTQYQSDTVTVNLRTVSVSTGEVLTSVTITKTVLSYMDKLGVLKFVSAGEQAIEAETGASINESINKATSMAIQAAVVATINEGARKGHWSFRSDIPTPIPTPVPVKEEVKKDEPRAETQVKTEEKPQANVSIPPKQTTKGVVLDYSNIRKGKALNSEKVFNLNPNDVVEIKKEDSTHYLVGVDGKEGWILRKFIRVQK